jgi:hypothetical protein
MNIFLAASLSLALALAAGLARAQQPPLPLCTPIEKASGAPCVDEVPPPPPPPLEPPAPKKRSRGAYAAGIALVSTGGAAMGMSLFGMLGEAATATSWFGCGTHCGADLVGWTVGFSAGTVLFLAGFTLFVYGKQSATEAPPPLVVTATGNGITARADF